ncbi:hypothetical protein [Kocuria massiliensis]|uniref:hypothetical protein n=1 Tax=Kocuria massiliensis TaxID=1926282 RepID=UPI000A1CDEF7|nr:hypothetical protein [Kocuria massiliensis]
MTEHTRLHDDPLELWRSLAQLSPRVLPHPRPAERSLTIKDYLPGHALPWEPSSGHVSYDRTRSWQHVVYAGLVPYGTLVAHANLAPPETAPGLLTALFAVRLEESGRLLPESLEVSRAAWAVAHLSSSISATYRESATLWRQRILDLFRDRRVVMKGVRYPRLPGDVEQDHQLNHDDVAAAVKVTNELFGLTELTMTVSRPMPTRIVSTLATRTLHVGDSSLLNHPAAEDLDLATETTRYRQSAAGLLGIDAAETFEDVVESREALYYALAPQMLPEGVSRPERSSVATQFAVNAALNDLSRQEGLWCCPAQTAAGMPDPRWVDDMVSGLVTRRAEALASIPDPAEIFDPEPTEWSAAREIHLPHPDLENFEVIRSAPLRSGAAVPQGRAAVVRLLPGMEELEPYRGLPAAQPIDAVDAIDGVLNRLGHARVSMTAEDYDRWDETAESVHESLATVRRLVAERQRYHEAVPMLLRTEGVISDLAEALAESAAGISDKERELKELSQANDRARKCSKEWSDRIAAHLRDEPPMLWRLATFGRARTPWHLRLTQLRREQSEAQAEEQGSQSAVDRVHRDLRQLREAHEGLRDDLEENQKTVASLREELAAYPHAQDAMDGDWLAGDWNDQAFAPWLDDELQAARYTAYQAALRMHSMAIHGLPAEFREGLLAARDLLCGHPSRNPDAVRAAWEILGMVFPQVMIHAELLPGICRSLGETRVGWIVYSDAERIRGGVAYAGLLHSTRGVLYPRSDGPETSALAVRGDDDVVRPEDDPVQRFDAPYLLPPTPVQEALAAATSCSLRWTPDRTTAYGLALAASKYTPPPKLPEESDRDTLDPLPPLSP